jgi:capsid portal protein
MLCGVALCRHLFLHEAVPHKARTTQELCDQRFGMPRPSNFRNLFLYSPNGKKDGVQVIPISEVAAKDEFLGIKDATRDDILAVHRIPPQLLGIVPKRLRCGRASGGCFRQE